MWQDIKGDFFMTDKNKKGITDANPYRFDLTGDFICDGHHKIASLRNRIRTEAKIKKDISASPDTK